MPYYRILSCPVQEKAPLGYKGIYRCEPDYRESDGKELHDLWYRYVEYAENGAVIGVSNELSRKELLYYCKMLSLKHNIESEVVCIERDRSNMAGTLYYGMDVSSLGGYSMIGEGLFSENAQSRYLDEIREINRYFKPKLNQYGLFEIENDAKLFLTTLKSLRLRNLVEPEDSFIFHISHVND